MPTWRYVINKYIEPLISGYMKKKAVIVFPDFVNYRKLLKKAGFKIEKEFEQYIHRSLSRKVVKVK